MNFLKVVILIGILKVFFILFFHSNYVRAEDELQQGNNETCKQYKQTFSRVFEHPILKVLHILSYDFFCLASTVLSLKL